MFVIVIVYVCNCLIVCLCSSSPPFHINPYWRLCFGLVLLLAMNNWMPPLLMSLIDAYDEKMGQYSQIIRYLQATLRQTGATTLWTNNCPRTSQMCSGLTFGLLHCCICLLTIVHPSLVPQPTCCRKWLFQSEMGNLSSVYVHPNHFYDKVQPLLPGHPLLSLLPCPGARSSRIIISKKGKKKRNLLLEPEA